MQPTAQQFLDSVAAHNYALAVVILLIGGVYLVRKAMPMIHGPLGAWLNSDRGGSTLVLVGSALGAIASTLAAGAQFSTKLVLSCVMTAATASGSWNILKDLLAPSDKKAAKKKLADTVVHPPEPPRAAMLIPFVALSFFAAGCACWKPEHRNDPVCAVVHQVIQCSESALTTGVASLVGQYINGVAEPSWDAVLQKLEQAGIKDGGCILAQLQNDFSGMMAAGPNGANAKAVAVNDLMGRWKIKHKLEGVRYQLKLADGRTVLR